MARPPRQDYSADVRKHDSLAVRLLLAAAGTCFVVLGLVGIFTPFLLLAAACYARASTRFYNWLLNNRVFGPAILEWRRHRSIAYRTKLVAIATMAVTFVVSIVFFVRPAWLQFALAAFGVGLAVWMYRIPSRDRLERDRSLR